jgi:hypothetical protein
MLMVNCYVDDDLCFSGMMLCVTAAAFCSVVLSDTNDQAPDDRSAELSKKEIELLLLHQRYEFLPFTVTT